MATFVPIGGGAAVSIPDSDLIQAFNTGGNVRYEDDVIIIRGKQYRLSSFSGFGGGGGVYQNEQKVYAGGFDFNYVNSQPLGAPVIILPNPITIPADKLLRQILLSVSVPFRNFALDTVVATTIIPNVNLRFNTIQKLGFNDVAFGFDLISLVPAPFAPSFNFENSLNAAINNPQGFTQGRLDMWFIMCDSPI